MIIRFNEEKEFPVITINETSDPSSLNPNALIIFCPYSIELYNDIYNFLINNIVNKIEILNDLHKSIYITTNLTKVQGISKTLSSEVLNIQLNFIANI